MLRNLIIAIVALVAILAIYLLLPGKKVGGGEKTIRVVRNIGGREGFRRHWDAWKAAFEKDNPGWNLQLVDIGDNDFAAYYKTRLASDDMPEIIMTWAMTKFFADGGKLMPVSGEYYDRFGIEKPPAYKGQWYTTQSGLQLLGVAVNRKHWQAIGVTEPPKTWDEFLTGLRALKAKGIVPLAYGGREWSAGVLLQTVLHTELYDRPGANRASWTKRKNRGEISFATDPNARVIMTNLAALLQEFVGKAALSDGYAEEGRKFYGGTAATWIMGCWLCGELEPNKVDQDIAYWPVPSMLGRPPVFVGNYLPQNGWAISSGVLGPKGQMTARAEKCRAAFDAFYAPEVYQQFLNGEAQFSVATKVAVKGPQSAWPAAQRLFAQMQAGVKQYGTTPGYYLGVDDVPPQSMKWPRVMQQILVEKPDVDRILRSLDEEWSTAQRGEE